MAGMRTTTTVGFSVAPTDRSRLDHLAEIFGDGNRSNFLRRAMDVMERLEAVKDLQKTQAYGADRLSEQKRSLDDVPRVVEQALTDPDPAIVAQAKLVVSLLAKERHRVDAAGRSTDGVVAEALADALSDS
jgi:hypothetical protein